MDCEREIAQIASEKINICQGYYGSATRFRKCTSRKVNYYLTFKCNTENRVIEIETKIDERDFTDVWGKCLNKVHKIRYKVLGWDVDFFLDHNDQVYFAMAEIEMPEGQKGPGRIPSFISNNLVFAVPLGDCRFSSKNLSDVRHAKKLLKEI